MKAEGLRLRGVIAFGLLPILIRPISIRADLVEVDLPYLADNCEHVVRGTVVSVESAWNEVRTRVFTEIVIRVREDLKGNVAAPDGTLTLTEMGGTVGATVMAVQHTPLFAVGEEVLVFTERRPDDRLVVLGRTQGKITLQDSDDPHVRPAAQGKIAYAPTAQQTVNQVRQLMIERGYTPVLMGPVQAESTRTLPTDSLTQGDVDAFRARIQTAILDRDPVLGELLGEAILRDIPFDDLLDLSDDNVVTEYVARKTLSFLARYERFGYADALEGAYEYASPEYDVPQKLRDPAPGDPPGGPRDGACSGGGCTNSTTLYPSSLFTTTSSSWTTFTSCAYAGEHSRFWVENGATYEWTACSTDGASCSWDSQFMLRNTSGSNICYNDDWCGLQSKIMWTATFTGEVHLARMQYYCATNTTCATLRWRMASPPPPTCTPDFTVTAPYSVSGRTTCGAGNDCDLPGSDNEDHIYEVTIPCTSDWLFSLCGSSYDTKLMVGTTCCGQEVGYNDDNGPGCSGLQSSILATGLAAGTYYVMVDGYGSNCGSYVLNISLAADPCASVTTMSFGTPYSGTLGTCGSWPNYTNCIWDEPGEERVYQFTTTVAGDYTLTGTVTSGDPDFFLMSACDPASTNLIGACWDSGTRTVSLAASTTYYFIVDNYSGSSSAGYTIQVDPPGPTCTPDFTVTAPFGQSSSTCGAGNDCSLRSTEEHIYEVTIPTSGDWVFSLCTGSSYDTYLFVGTTCCGNEIGTNDDYCSLYSQITANISAGTYYVTVEGFSGCGGYGLDVYMAGDDCAHPFSISSLPFSDTGSTASFTNGYDEVCPYSGSTSPDVVYVYTPGASDCVDISLCTNSAYDTKLYVYENSCPNLLACNDDSCSTPSFPSPYVSELPGLNLTGGNTYYVVVDGYAGGSGSYTIDIVSASPVAPTSALVDRNNFCADDSGNISLTVSGGSGDTVRWFTGGCGTTSIGTGSPLVIASPTSTTTYYARWENSCGNSSCASVTVTVLPLPSAPSSASVDRNNFCADDSGTITLSVSGRGAAAGAFGRYDFRAPEEPGPPPLPPSLAYEIDIKSIAQARLGPVDVPALLEEDAERALIDKVLRYGVGRDILLEVGDGQWYEVPGLGNLWIVEVISEGAIGIRLHFSDVDLPDGAQILVYGSSQPERTAGPYNGRGILGDGQFWTPTRFGERVRVEYFVPADATDDLDAVAFVVDGLQHIYRDPIGGDGGGPRGAGPCHNDVTCFPAWANVAASSAGIGWIDSDVLWCSGTLLDNTSHDLTPYFLTANHCLSTNPDAQSSEIYWFYQTSTCDGSPPALSSVPQTAGAQLLSTGPSSDYTLLLLTGSLPPGLFYAGWTSGTVPDGTASACIHHPAGDYKRISFGNKSSTISCGGDDHIRMDWTDGPTEPGSSGSGCFRSDTQQLFGQLHCGPSACGNETSDQYGAFSATFPSVQSWLDPSGGGGDILVWYSGSCGGTQVGTGSPLVIASPTSTTTYYARRENSCGNSSCASVTVTVLPVPSNDTCAGAITVSLGTPVSGNTADVCCNSETLGTCGTSDGTGGALWYKITGNGNLYTATTCNAGSSYDTKIRVYTDGCGTLTCVAGNDDSCSGYSGLLSTVNWCAESGREYLILVHGFSSYEGTFELAVTDDDCSSLDGECTVGVCNPGATSCSASPANEGGACGGSPSGACDAQNTCSSGTCVNNYQPGGTLCRADAGDCDVPEYCTGSSPSCPGDAFEPSGTACGGAPSGDCDAQNTCNASGSCISNYEPPSTLCRADAGDCDVPEYCTGSSPNCPGDVFEPDGTGCNDNLFCNGADTCSGGGCSQHAGDPCAGGAECDNSCNESAGNCYTASGTPCTDDGNVCTDNECDGAGACAAYNNTDPCNDNDACTTDDTCSGGACLGGSALNCNDLDPCTDDWCDSGTGCVNPPNNPLTPTNAGAAPSVICAGESTTLAASVGGAVIDWYTGSCGGTYIDTGNSIGVTPGSTTTYYARARNSSTGCESSGCDTVTVTVNSLPGTPTAPGASPAVICVGDWSDISASVGPGVEIDWYTGGCEGTYAGTGNPLAVNPTTTTTYYGLARDSSSGCVSTSCTTVTVTVDTTAPSITFCPPDVTQNADAGYCTAVVSTGTAAATDDHDPNPDITYVRSDNPGLLATDPFPTGTTTITWRATDDCGNYQECQQNITVDPVNELVVDVELSPTVAASLTRCITFEFFECGGSSVEVQEEIAFTNGLAGGVSLLVPCGFYDCLTARDELHALRRTDETFAIIGVQYDADFTGDPVGGGDWLVNGNLNDDDWLDIIDFGIYVNRWAVSYGSGDTSCATTPYHADISGNGMVSTEDFTFIQINFFQGSEPNCCGLPGMRAGGQDGPLAEISVIELQDRGLGYLAVADLNEDGWVDQTDIVAFLHGARPARGPIEFDGGFQGVNPGPTSGSAGGS